VEQPEAAPRWASHGLLALLALGVVLRLGRVLFPNWIWLDEASLALMIEANGYRQLAEPLANMQVAPVGYLWLTKLCAQLLGSYREVVLRLPALLAGLACMGGTALLARRLLPPWGALAATGVMAVSPTLLYYSWEAKQYSTEAAVAVAILAASLSTAGPWGLRPLPRALLLAAVAPWFSLPSVFFLPALLALAWRRDRERPWGLLAGLVALLLVSAALAIAWARGVHALAGDYTTAFHDASFAPLAEGPGAVLAWVVAKLLGLVGNLPHFAGGAWVGAAPAALGIWWLARRRPELLALGAGAIPLWLLAGIVGVYPPILGGSVRLCRLSLHMLPLVALVLGAGVAALEEGRAPRRAPVVALILVVAALLQHPKPGSKLEVKPELERVFAELRPGDVVGLSAGTHSIWEYHGRVGRVPAPGPQVAMSAGTWWDEYKGRSVEFPAGTERVWWLDTQGLYHGHQHVDEWRAGLEAGFQRAAQQPPEKYLSLWVRRTTAP
jgi:4-amino-4-deoxy-L-arabinose transferase-like glycosyltransferase